MKIYTEKDSSLAPMQDKTAAILGYGNQGRAQGLNLRDSGVSVIVGNRDDSYLQQARDDGFKTFPIKEAASLGDFLFILTTDESQPSIWDEHIAPGIAAGNVLVWASGYNLGYDLIKPPADVDIVMVAPRMTGFHVRKLFEAGKGAMALVAVHQDVSGQAWERMMAISKGIGTTRGGVIDSSFREEAELDLFDEQIVWPGLVSWFEECFKIGVENGFPPELMVMELYASGEAAEILGIMSEQGFYQQMGHHSTTSQYGTLSRAPLMLNDANRSMMRKLFTRDIRGGQFVKEWTTEQLTGETKLTELKNRAMESAMAKAEKKILPILKK